MYDKDWADSSTSSHSVTFNSCLHIRRQCGQYIVIIGSIVIIGAITMILVMRVGLSIDAFVSMLVLSRVLFMFLFVHLSDGV